MSPRLRTALGLLAPLLATVLACAQARPAMKKAAPVDPSEQAYRRGDHAAALKALPASAPRTRAPLLRGLAALQRGQKDAARTEFSRITGWFDRSTLSSGPELADAAEAMQHLGRFQEANDLFREAAKRLPADAMVRVRWANLFRLKHNDAEAIGLLEEAVKIEPENPAVLTGMASLMSARWDAGAERIITEALTADPGFVPALVLQARVALEDDKIPKAEEFVKKALELQPDSVEALTMHAAAAYLSHDRAALEQRFADVLKINPGYGEAYATVAHFAELHRQFDDARAFLQTAVEKNPTLWDAHAKLGINWLRLGRDSEAQRALEVAYNGDAFNTSTVNTLRLMDSFARYERLETPNFRIKLHQKEAAVLRPYVEELLERSLTTLSGSYRFKVSEKVSFEMFPDHEDFAVRTLGVPGLGALGASFGKIVAMDSPQARPVGEFHWGSTLWHEVAHVVTLQATLNRIPRWFTEGLSVYEEYRQGWGDRLDLETVQHLQKDRLMPIADLNKGFIRPAYPGQVQFAYFQGGMLCRFLAEKYGFQKILTLLEQFKNNQETEAALEKVYGRPLKDLDTDFKAWVTALTGPVVKAVDFEWRAPRKREELEAEAAKRPGNFFARIQLARVLYGAMEYDKALPHAQAARDLFPEHVASGNGYEIAADCLEKKDDRASAANELLRWVKAGGLNPVTANKAAKMLIALNRRPEAIKALEEFLYIAPLDLDIHRQLGALLLEAGRLDGAIREYGAVVALKPVDMAQANYELARAYWAARKTSEARRKLLEALEAAPNFSPAQKLLLEITDKEGNLESQSKK